MWLQRSKSETSASNFESIIQRCGLGFFVFTCSTFGARRAKTGRTLCKKVKLLEDEGDVVKGGEAGDEVVDQNGGGVRGERGTEVVNVK